MRVEFYAVALAVTAAAVVIIGQTTNTSTQPLPAPTDPGPPLRNTVFATGLVEGHSRVLELGFEIPGRVDSLPAQAGQHVAEGDRLASLNAAPQRALLEQADSEVQVARQRLLRLENGAPQVTIDVQRAKVASLEVELRHASTTLARTRQLLQQRAESERQYELHLYDRDLAAAKLQVGKAELEELLVGARPEDIDAARQQLASAEARRRHAEAQLAQHELLAPVTGQVLSVECEVGGITDPTETLITMVDDRSLRVRAFIEEYDAARVAPEQRAIITSTTFQTTIAGRVIWCAPQLSVKPQLRNRPEELSDVKVREVLVDVPLEAKSVLLFQMPVDLEIEVAPR